MRVTVIGCGYVGLTTSIALSYIGHKVHCIDKDKNCINNLQKGKIPIHEAGLAEIFEEAREQLTYGCWESFNDQADVVIIAVGTPRKDNGDANLKYVETVAYELGQRLYSDSLPVVAIKSTVPIGSAQRVESVIVKHLRQRSMHKRLACVSNPEFLREGIALFDTFYPDRIVIGAKEYSAAEVLLQMYMPILEQTFVPPRYIQKPDGYDFPAIIFTTPTSAELIKYAANAFLAMKISYINEIACLSEKVGADIKEVARGVGLDRRIGPLFLEAGIGWGGSCFGKDLQALIYTANQYGYEMPLCCAAVQVNNRMREEIVKKLQSVIRVIRGSTVGLLGLSFKPGTDDLRDAPSITIAGRLIELGAHVKVYDPVAMDNCRKSYPALDVEYAASPEELADGADALLLITEWNDFTNLSFDQIGELMRQKIIIDGRNILNSGELAAQGFKYFGIGR